MRPWIAASLLVVTSLYAQVTRQWFVGVPLAVLLLVAILTPLRLPLGVAGGRVGSGLAAAAGAVVGWLAPLPAGVDVLHRPWPALALAGLFVGVARLFLGADGPASLGLVPGLAALMASGETSAGPAYGVAVVLWLWLGLQGLRAGDPGRPAVSVIPRRDRLVTAGLVGLGAGLAALSVLLLPPASRWTERRVLRALGEDQTGFSERMWLGALDGLLDSDEVVMRLSGPRTDYLRGAVFEHYEIGRWGHRTPARPRPVESAPATGEGRVRISVVGGARDRYFLPLDAAGVSAGGTLAADRFGVLRVGEGLAAEVSFVPGGPPAFPADEPSDDDLDVPPVLRRTVKRLAEEWTRGAETPEARVRAIAEHLRTGFTYARTFERRRADALLDFLLDDHRGHCEYFASATVMIARAAGVPARAVVGYRVAEENVLGHYWVVRQKNAHAWAEVYLPGKGFVTVDATPADDVAQNEAHASGLVAAVWDLAGAWWSGAVARLTVWDLVGAGGAIILVGLVVRQIRRLPRGRRARAAGERWERPPPSLARLFEALGRRGLVRGEAEPIERFAARVEGEGVDEAADVLRRWAAFRYGGIGDGQALAGEMEGCAARLRRA